MSLLKFVKTAKYDSLMFKPIHIDKEQQNVIKIKYDRFVFIPTRKIIGQPKLEKNNIYRVNIKQWTHNEFHNTRFILTPETGNDSSECLL